MVRIVRQLSQAGPVVALSILVAGCTTHVSLDPFDMPGAHGAKIPASIGIYYPPAFAIHPVREQLTEDVEEVAIETDIGPASRSVIEATLRSSFDNVIIVGPDYSEALAEGQIDAVAVPEITRFDYAQYGGTTRVVVGYAIEFLHRDGRSQSVTATGRETDKARGAFGFEYLRTAAPKKIAAAMRAAATDLWFRLQMLADEEDWFGELIRFADAERAEMQGILAPADGHCSVFVYLENLGFYDEYVDAMFGVIVFAGEGRRRWLPDAGRYARYDLRPGKYVVRYGPAVLVRALDGDSDAAQSDVTETFEIDCQVGRSRIYGLRYWTAGTLKVNSISPADAVGEIRLRAVVTDADPKGPPM